MRKKIFKIEYNTMKDIADAVREKREISSQLFPYEIINNIVLYWPYEWSGSQNDYDSLVKPVTEMRYYITSLSDASEGGDF